MAAIDVKFMKANKQIQKQMGSTYTHNKSKRVTDGKPRKTSKK